MHTLAVVQGTYVTPNKPVEAPHTAAPTTLTTATTVILPPVTTAPPPALPPGSAAQWAQCEFSVCVALLGHT